MANREEKDALSDSELVGRCLQGDDAAWSQLIGRYQRLVYSVAHALCSDPDDAADVFQATCLDLYKGLPLLRDVKALPAWLITVTRRRSIAALRAKIPTSNSDENLEELGPTLDVIQAIEHEHAIERGIGPTRARCLDKLKKLLT
jgi:RNA polymerase sigma factor (sigma-70 family)